MEKPFALLLVALVMVFTAPAVNAESPNEGKSAREIMEGTVVEVVAILHDAKLTSEERRSELETIAYDRFDFRTMSRLVLAKNWRRLSKEQRKAFVAEFRTYLANDYGSRLDRYGNEDAAVTGERKEPRGDITVKTEIRGGEADGAQVDYRMRKQKKGDDWLIIDVVIEGISLVANFRDQFREVISSGGPEGLLEKLKEKNAEKQAT